MCLMNSPLLVVTCTNSGPFTTTQDMSCVVVNGPGFVTQLTVIVRMRQVGTYISNAIVDVLLEIFNTATNSYDNILNLDFIFSL